MLLGKRGIGKTSGLDIFINFNLISIFCSVFVSVLSCSARFWNRHHDDSVDDGRLFIVILGHSPSS